MVLLHSVIGRQTKAHNRGRSIGRAAYPFASFPSIVSPGRRWDVVESQRVITISGLYPWSSLVGLERQHWKTERRQRCGRPGLYNPLAWPTEFSFFLFSNVEASLQWEVEVQKRLKRTGEIHRNPSSLNTQIHTNSSRSHLTVGILCQAPWPKWTREWWAWTGPCVRPRLCNPFQARMTCNHASATTRMWAGTNLCPQQ